MAWRTLSTVPHSAAATSLPAGRLHGVSSRGGTRGAGPSPEIYKVAPPSGHGSPGCTVSSSPRVAPPLEGKENVRATPSWSLSHCLAFFTMVPTAEITVVLEPLALVVTVTTAGRVAVVVRMVGWAIVVTGMAESHLLFLFWASGGKASEKPGSTPTIKQHSLSRRPAVRAQGAETAGLLASESQGAASEPGPHPRLQSGLSTNHSEARPCSPKQGREALAPSVEWPGSGAAVYLQQLCWPWQWWRRRRWSWSLSWCPSQTLSGRRQGRALKPVQSCVSTSSCQLSAPRGQEVDTTQRRP